MFSRIYMYTCDLCAAIEMHETYGKGAFHYYHNKGAKHICPHCMEIFEKRNLGEKYKGHGNARAFRISPLIEKFI